MRLLITGATRWHGRASFAGKSFGSVHQIPLHGLFQEFSSE